MEVKIPTTSKETLPKGLYFVHYAYTDKPLDGSGSTQRKLILTEESIEKNRVQGYMVDADEMGVETEIPQGSFVYFDGQKLISAEDNPTAIMYSEINSKFAGSINYLNYGNQARELSGVITDICSYHVQIGNESCSMIALKEDGKGTVFMVDCSVFDFMDGRDYSGNLDACLQQINADYQTDKISKLLITHQHYDHINGIEYLIRKGWVDKETEVWMNTRYPWKSAVYSRILIQLSALGVRFIDPVAENSTQHIKVLYPDISRDAKNKAMGENINNASVLYQIGFRGRKMLFVGDMEMAQLEQVLFCEPFLNSSLYVYVSNHSDVAKNIKDANVLEGHNFVAETSERNIAKTSLLEIKNTNRENGKMKSTRLTLSKDYEVVLKEEGENKGFFKLKW